MPRGHDEVTLTGVQLLEWLLEGGQAKEPVLLLVALERDLVDRAAVALRDLVLDLEIGAPRAVPTLVQALVCVSVFVHPLEHLLDAALVLLVSGADKEIVGRVQTRRQGLE